MNNTVFTRNNSARAGPRQHAPARVDEFMRNNSEGPAAPKWAVSLRFRPNIARVGTPELLRFNS